MLNAKINISPESDVGPRVALVGLLHLVKLKVERGVLQQLSRPGQLLDQREELVVVAPVVVQLDLADELDLDALVLEAVGLPVEGHVDLRRQK